MSLSIFTAFKEIVWLATPSAFIVESSAAVAEIMLAPARPLFAVAVIDPTELIDTLPNELVLVRVMSLPSGALSFDNVRVPIAAVALVISIVPPLLIFTLPSN